MYSMYPDYSEAPKERGAGGLGHYDYPVYETPSNPTVEVAQTPDVPITPSPEAERAVGYISVNEMVME